MSQFILVEKHQKKVWMENSTVVNMLLYRVPKNYLFTLLLETVLFHSTPNSYCTPLGNVYISQQRDTKETGLQIKKQIANTCVLENICNEKKTKHKINTIQITHSSFCNVFLAYEEQNIASRNLFLTSNICYKEVLMQGG